ncbi:MAG: alpha-E domain-containing protein [Arachnia sp.]
MLSRIADSLFWIGRYLERAEDTCRIVDVHLQQRLDDPHVDQPKAARHLLELMGAPATAEEPDVLHTMCYDEASPASFLAALAGARESARRARETVPTDVWESINTTWLAVRGGRLQRMRPASMFKLIRERCAVIAGLADSTMTHDEGWMFLVLGRSIERVDMTARLISTPSLGTNTTRAWGHVLSGCGAHHAFVQRYGALADDRQAAEFLMRDKLFPRSLVATLMAAEQSLRALAPPSERRPGGDDVAARLLGGARAGLEFMPPDEVLSALPDKMADLQLACSRATDAISRRYFEGASAAEWVGGAW